MSEHTSGPWFDVGFLQEGYDWTGIVADGPISVATVHTPEHKNAQPGEAEANARLIAAAPKLLAALKGLVAFTRVNHERLAKVRDCGHVFSEEILLASAVKSAAKMVDALKLADAAIAEAEQPEENQQ